MITAFQASNMAKDVISNITLPTRIIRRFNRRVKFAAWCGETSVVLSFWHPLCSHEQVAQQYAIAKAYFESLGYDVYINPYHSRINLDWASGKRVVNA